MAFEHNGTSCHKRNADNIDIETVIASTHAPATVMLQPQSQTDHNIHLRPLQQHHSQRQLQHQHQHRWCSFTVLLYITFFSLLLIWIGLQLLILAAQIYLNNSDNNSSSQSTLQQTTALFLRINNNNNNNMTTININDGNYGILFGSSVMALVDQIRRGASSLLMLNPSPSQEDSTEIIVRTIDPSQRIEEDYVFIFYVLLGINFLAMFPRWYGHLAVSSSRKKRIIYSTDTGTVKEVTHPQDQQQKIIGEEAQALIHSKLLQTYLPAYLFATMADWLQGPYKYALYSSYGYTQRDIAHLFVAGYGSGMVLGSIVGGLADSYGRKRLCICYCLSYTFSVLMKHCKHFYALLLGRVGGGIATSLLFSVFESWLICAHRQRGLGSSSSKNNGLTKEEEEKWLAKSLSTSMYGSSLVAIGSGVVANVVVASSGKMRPWDGNDESFLYIGGYIAAFDVCLVPLMLCAALIMVLWEENYGGEAATAPSAPELIVKEVSSNDQHVFECQSRPLSGGYLKKHSSIHLEDVEFVEKEEKRMQNEECATTLAEEKNEQKHSNERMCSALVSGIHTVWNSPNILICCIIGSVFEGAMYIFIFLWTPSLSALQEKLDFDKTDGGIAEATTQKDPHEDSELPFGWIFSSFMVCCMLGTITFSALSNAGVTASKCLAGILALSSLSCLAMALPYSDGIGRASSSANTPQYIGMLLYEFCIGFYYPAMGTVKGTIVPEDQRAAIYNVFRLPLNLLVLVYLVGDFSTEKSFLANAILLLVACGLQVRMVKGSDGIAGSTKRRSSELDRE